MTRESRFHFEISDLKDEDLEAYSVYQRINPIEVRTMIWDLVQTNTPIPKALRPFVAQLLSTPVKGHETSYRDREIVKDMAFRIYEDKITVENAANEFAIKYSKSADTILRIYKSGKHSKLKSRIRRGVKNE